MTVIPRLAGLASMGLVMAFCASGARCDITHDAARNCIWVTDFSEDDPATMETVRAADRRMGLPVPMRQKPTSRTDDHRGRSHPAGPRSQATETRAWHEPPPRAMAWWATMR
jgi:hypothetical protein